LRRIPLSGRSHIIGFQPLATVTTVHESALERDFVGDRRYRRKWSDLAQSEAVFELFLGVSGNSKRVPRGTPAVGAINFFDAVRMKGMEVSHGRPEAPTSDREPTVSGRPFMNAWTGAGGI